MKQLKISRSFALPAMAVLLALSSYPNVFLAAQSKAKQKEQAAVKTAGKVTELRDIGQLKEAFLRARLTHYKRHLNVMPGKFDL